ncbi:HipA N-terminal domain-containing protein [Luteimonas sp. S4-F44]|uniref:HipA N-terminal domain-containing protein n=1 Tax=Luteimonas sp. S4-F44 TaxID=2925842 RepID=UPI001F53230F|nr:HipA N-terminal domain-containing protein [Luteimonas sp. S4-F44]UNK42416.1 HipA N-terminal domain-containing protein [Luteimonas sp. S4-F44]
MSPVPADVQAIDQVEVWLDAAGLGGEALVGHLARLPSRTGDTIQFQYADDWVDGTAPIRSFALDPQLPLHRGPHVARTGASTLTAAFTDCSPDRWGNASWIGAKSSMLANRIDGCVHCARGTI